MIFLNAIVHKKNIFYFREGCQLVKGNRGGAIYDLISQNVYSIDGKLLGIIDSGKKNIEELVCEAKRKDIPERDLIRCLAYLDRLGLAFMSHKRYFINKIMSLREKTSRYRLNERINLESITCEIRSDCNLNCPQCQMDSNEIVNCSCRKAPRTGGESLSLKEWEEVLHIASLAECEKIRIIGGEPCLSKNELRRLFQMCMDMKFKLIELYTNGTLLDDEFIKIFKIMRVFVIVPIYSIDPLVHESITGVNGTFAKSMNNVIKMKKSNINVSVYLLIMKQNQDTVEKTISFLNKNNINCISRVIQPTQNISNSCLIPDKWAEYLYRVKPSFNKTSIESFFKRKIGNPCWIGSAAINSEGDVLPCIRANGLKVGNIRESSLKRMLVDNILEQYWFLSKDKIKTCKDCEFRYACDDCRLIALSFGGDILSRDPFCGYNPYTSTWETPS